MYSYDDRSVEVVNSTYQPGSRPQRAPRNFSTRACTNDSPCTVPVDVAADGVDESRARSPSDAFDPASPVYFVDLVLQRRFRQSAEHEFLLALGEEKRLRLVAEDNDAFTPVKSYEDFTALNRCRAPARLDVASSTSRSSAEGPLVAREAAQSQRSARVSGASWNPPARMKKPKFCRCCGRTTTFELMPGESREITAQFLIS